MYIQSQKFNPENIVLQQDFCLNENVSVTAICYERSVMDDIQITFLLNGSKEIDTIDVSVDESDFCQNATYESIINAMVKYIYANETMILQMNNTDIPTGEEGNSHEYDRPGCN